MRLFILSALTLMTAATAAEAQTVNCQLFGDEYAYGLFGTCKLDPAGEAPSISASQRLRYWPTGEVNVIVTSRPTDPSPWRGYFFQPGWADAFEMTKEQGPSGERFVLRSMVGWVTVHKWEMAGPASTALAFRLNYPRATTDDVSILSAALNSLTSDAAWDRNDDRDCTNDASGRRSVFCLLQTSARVQVRRYHHAQPALDIARRVILERWADRVNRGHAFTNFNNHAATTLADVRAVLDEALRRAREEAAGR